MLPTLANVTRYSMTTSINHRITRNAQIRHYEHFDIRKRVSKISDEKELARNYIVSGRQMKQFEKQKEEFNGILNASMCYYMSFPIFIWWTSNQDWFYERYVKPEAEMEKTIPPPIWEIMYKRRLLEKEAEEQKVNVQ